MSDDHKTMTVEGSGAPDGVTPLEQVAIAIFMSKNGAAANWGTFNERYRIGYRKLAAAAIEAMPWAATLLRERDEAVAKAAEIAASRFDDVAEKIVAIERANVANARAEAAEREKAVLVERAIEVVLTFPAQVPHVAHIPAQDDITSMGTPYRTEPYDYHTTRPASRSDIAAAIRAALAQETK